MELLEGTELSVLVDNGTYILVIIFLITYPQI